eukprot:gene40762-49710_t
MSASNVFKTPERARYLQRTPLSKSTPLMSARRSIADHSSSDLIDRCLNDLDELLKLTDEPGVSPLPRDDSSQATTLREVTSERSPSSSPVPSVASVSMQSDGGGGKKGSTSTVVERCVSKLDEIIAQRKRELSDLHRSGGSRSAAKKKASSARTELLSLPTSRPQIAPASAAATPPTPTLPLL